MQVVCRVEHIPSEYLMYGSELGGIRRDRKAKPIEFFPLHSAARLPQQKVRRKLPFVRELLPVKPLQLAQETSEKCYVLTSPFLRDVRQFGDRETLPHALIGVIV